jgi:hypothetical protein
LKNIDLNVNFSHSSLQRKGAKHRWRNSNFVKFIERAIAAKQIFTTYGNLITRDLRLSKNDSDIFLERFTSNNNTELVLNFICLLII